MSDKILVDTSAWVLSFRETGNPKLKDYLRDALDDDSVVTTNIILLELLQGCKSKKEYDTLKSRLDILPCYSLADHTWAIAYESGFSLRRKGITIPTVDIMICSIAKENALTLFHHDNHLKVISREMGVQAIDFIKA
jgi:predicted nucleic acid-binding protein